MELNENAEIRQYRAARKRARAIRGFYMNFTAFCVVIPALATLNLMYTPEVKWFFLTMACWGTGLVFHWMDAFGRRPFFGPAWEARKVRELMEKERSGGPEATNKEERREDELEQVRTHVRSVRRFYMHVAFYVLANATILGSIYVDLEDKGGFWSYNVFSTTVIWGLALLMHAGFLYSRTLFGPRWETRKIRELMEKDNS